MPTWAQLTRCLVFTSRQEPTPVPYNLQHLERSRQTSDFIAGGMSPDAIHAFVLRYGRQLGGTHALCNLRCALAQMLCNNGAWQIQNTLGHESMTTTVMYLRKQAVNVPSPRQQNDA